MAVLFGLGQPPPLRLRPETGEGRLQVSHVLDFPSRGQADKWSLGLLAEHGDADSITLERELVEGEVLDAALLKRWPPRRPRLAQASRWRLRHARLRVAAARIAKPNRETSPTQRDAIRG